MKTIAKFRPGAYGVLNARPQAGVGSEGVCTLLWEVRGITSGNCLKLKRPFRRVLAHTKVDKKLTSRKLEKSVSRSLSLTFVL